MAGEAKTSSFLLSTATVMIGPMEKLFELNPSQHSLGLVKNFQATSEPAYTELTQGVKNDVVYSVMTGNPVTASMEVYEYTSKNLAYGLGLDGSALVDSDVTWLLTDPIVGSASPVPPAVDEITVAASVNPGLAVGSWVSIQVADTDRVHIGQVAAATFLSGELTIELTAATAIPGNLSFPLGTKVRQVNAIQVGSKSEQPFLAAKVVGILPEGSKPVTLLIPKVRITRGFTLAFNSDNFGNLPYEFTVYDQTGSDPLFDVWREKVGNNKASLFV